MMKEITAAELRQRIAAGEHLILLDVREPYEHEEFDIGGTNIPLAELAFRVDELRALVENDIVVYCASGNRSVLAQKLLAVQFQITNTLSLIGGTRSWNES